MGYLSQSRGGGRWYLRGRHRGRHFPGDMPNSPPRLKTTLKFLNLSFEGVDTLGKVLPALLIPLAQPRGTAGTRQSDDRKDNEGNKSQPQH